MLLIIIRPMTRGNYIIPSTMNDITYYFLVEYYYFFFQLNKMETSYQKFKKLKVEEKKKSLMES